MNNKLKLTAIITLSILMFGANLSSGTTTSFAQEATESATEKKLDIKKLLSVNGVKNVLGLSSEKKEAVIGEVARVTDETITINSRQGTRIIPLENAYSITKNKEEIEVSDIAVENWVTVLGKIVDDNFTPIFLWVYSETLLPKNQYVNIGTITEITRNTVTITPRSGSEDKSVTITNSTDFEDINGSEISLNDLEEDITIIVSGHEDESKVEALTIRSLVPVFEDSESN